MEHFVHRTATFAGSLLWSLRISPVSAALVGMAVVLGVGSAPQSARAGTVFIAGGSQFVGAYDGSSAFNITSTLFPTDPPYSDSQTVIQGAGNSSTATYAFTNSQFDIQLSQSRSGELSSYGNAQGETYFYVDSDMTYSLAGHFNVTDNNDNPGYESLFVYLYDYASISFLSYNFSVSQDTANEHFTLGTGGGDYFSLVSGSLTGNLVAGNWYLFYYAAYAQAYPTSDDGGTASGRITLSFGDPAVVPLPAAVWGGMALMGLMGASKLRHRKLRAGQIPV